MSTLAMLASPGAPNNSFKQNQLRWSASFLALAVIKAILAMCAVFAVAGGAAAADPTAVRGDFDGDGVKDSAVLTQHKSHVSVAVRRGPNGKAQILQFRVDPAAQDAICDFPAELSASPATCNPMDDALPGCKELPGTVSLSLVGGDCDAIHMYWDHGAGRMEWWRL